MERLGEAFEGDARGEDAPRQDAFLEDALIGLRKEARRRDSGKKTKTPKVLKALKRRLWVLSKAFKKWARNS
jgi:hypothetical protein